MLINYNKFPNVFLITMIHIRLNCSIFEGVFLYDKHNNTRSWNLEMFFYAAEIVDLEVYYYIYYIIFFYYISRI